MSAQSLKYELIESGLNLVTKLKNVKTGYIDTLEFWLEVAEANRDRFDARTAQNIVTSQIWLNELVIV